MGRTKKILALRAGGPAARLHALDPKRFDDGAGHAGLLNHEELKDVQRNEKYKWHPSTVAQESLRLQNGNNTNKALTTKVTKFHEGTLESAEGLLQLVRYTQPFTTPAPSPRVLRMSRQRCVRVCPRRKTRR